MPSTGGKAKGSAREQVALLAVTLIVGLAVLGVAALLHRSTGNRWWYIFPGGVAAVAVGMVNRVIGHRWLGWGSVDAEGVRVGLAGPPERLDERVYRECEAMAEYALSSGAAVPDDVLQTLGDLAAAYPQRVPRTRRDAAAVEEPGPPSGSDYARLGKAHHQLAVIVAPATPRSLRIINEGQFNRVLTFLGRVRLVRLMIYVAVALLGAFIALAMKADFSPDKGVFGATGDTKLYNALELVAAAGLGAIFYGLHKANRYVTRGSYDPKYEASYWIRFTLGIVAGILLAVVLEVGGNLSKPVLALLGGFAAEAVYKILVRFVEMLETLVDGTAGKAKAEDAPLAAAAGGPPPGGGPGVTVVNNGAVPADSTGQQQVLRGG